MSSMLKKKSEIETNNTAKKCQETLDNLDMALYGKTNTKPRNPYNDVSSEQRHILWALDDAIYASEKAILKLQPTSQDDSINTCEWIKHKIETTNQDKNFDMVKLNKQLQIIFDQNCINKN